MTELNPENLKVAIDSLKRKMGEDRNPMHLFVPVAEKKLNKRRYKGKGRPRNMDYDYVKIDYKKILGIS